jgi:ABC-2 type transport system ATP-binding protein
MREIDIWWPAGQGPSEAVLELGARIGARGGARAAAGWREHQPETMIAYAHGFRHDLWWEFPLQASFQWQALTNRMHPAFCQQRLQRLAGLFDLTRLLERRVDLLTPAERVRANLAVALLPQPDVLVWEEPFAELDPQQWLRACRSLRRLCRTDGLTVIMVAQEEIRHECEDETWVLRAGNGRSFGTAGRRPAAGGAGA